MKPLFGGSRLFDSGAFFEAHEAWEELWRVETDETRRRILQGLIRNRSGIHKLFVTGCAASASRLLVKGTAKLDGCPTNVVDMNVAAFREGVRACAEALAAGCFNHTAIPRVAWKGAHSPSRE